MVSFLSSQASSRSQRHSYSRVTKAAPTTTKQNELTTEKALRALPWSMQLISGLCCQECTITPLNSNLNLQAVDKELSSSNVGPNYDPVFQSLAKSRSSISPLVVAPMLHLSDADMSIVQEYTQTCNLYNTPPNAGVLITLKFSLPSLRVSNGFTDIDMLCLCELLLKHCNGKLSYIRRLDFSKASRPGGASNSARGFTSHGAFCLAKVLLQSTRIQQVWLQRNRIGPYGASAIFVAASTNATLTNINMRRCRIGERGGVALAEVCLGSLACGLKDVDISANHIGFRGSLTIEQAMLDRGPNFPALNVDLEGNLVLQGAFVGSLLSPYFVPCSVQIIHAFLFCLHLHHTQRSCLESRTGSVSSSVLPRDSLFQTRSKINLKRMSFLAWYIQHLSLSCTRRRPCIIPSSP